MLRFRPHHFLCTLGFQGKGYSPAFVDHFQKIANQLREPKAPTDQIQIEVVQGADLICEPCPNRTGSLCKTESKIDALDTAHEKVLGLTKGEIITWGKAKQRLAKYMTDSEFDQACAPCGWKSLGACRSALVQLRSEHHE